MDLFAFEGGSVKFMSKLLTLPLRIFGSAYGRQEMARRELHYNIIKDMPFYSTLIQGSIAPCADHNASDERSSYVWYTSIVL